MNFHNTATVDKKFLDLSTRIFNLNLVSLLVSFSHQDRKTHHERSSFYVDDKNDHHTAAVRNEFNYDDRKSHDNHARVAHDHHARNSHHEHHERNNHHDQHDRNHHDQHDRNHHDHAGHEIGGGHHDKKTKCQCRHHQTKDHVEKTKQNTAFLQAKRVFKAGKSLFSDGNIREAAKKKWPGNQEGR
mgnify:CR=1 FL=1